METQRPYPNLDRTPQPLIFRLWERFLAWPGRQILGLILASGVFATLPFYFDLSALEARLYDFRMATAVPEAWQAKPSPDIVLIALDDHTTRELEDVAPLSLEQHLGLLEQLAHFYQPRGIGYLIDFNDVQLNHPESFRGNSADQPAPSKHSPQMPASSPSQFLALAQELQQQGRPFLLGTPFDVTGERLPPYPLSQLPHSVAVIHRDGNVFAEDRVTRRALSHNAGQPSFHLDFAQRLGWSDPANLPRGAFQIPELDLSYFFFRYHGNPGLPLEQRGANQDFHHQSGPYAIYPFVDVLRREIPLEALKDKVVLVGKVGFDDPTDFALTPYSRAPFSTPKLSVHATIVDSIAKNDSIIRVPSAPAWFAGWILGFFTLFWLYRRAPLRGVVGVVGITAASFVLSTVLFQWGGLWIRLSEPIVTILLSYYLGVPYRLVVEYKKRWNFQRKNELLTQVEELKTHFVSLVTHDLKTPVARIQGLTETMLRRFAAGSPERKSSEQILNATEELNHFITSILELNRIESNRFSLRLQSRDINSVIEAAARSLEPDALRRKIRIDLQLDPLFPIVIDPELIDKVLKNLIDNALKYSPEGTRVTIRSREIGNTVQVSVRDHGIGMNPEEQSQLFTRFFRAKNDQTTRITGTGLGLYLSRYFVEAHGGQLSVSSDPGQGSEF